MPYPPATAVTVLSTTNPVKFTFEIDAAIPITGWFVVVLRMVVQPVLPPTNDVPVCETESEVTLYVPHGTLMRPPIARAVVKAAAESVVPVGSPRSKPQHLPVQDTETRNRTARGNAQKIAVDPASDAGRQRSDRG
jgi:hypothetical protein